MSDKHKVFISYYHNDDESYRDKFEELFGDLFINKCVKPGDIDEDLSTNYIKRLIQENYISDTSVVVVLVGPKTYCRKHVDWEISAGLMKKVGGYSGLLGLCLPEHPDYNNNNIDEKITPPRLLDNIKSGYAKYYNWTTNKNSIKKIIETAFKAKNDEFDLINNSRSQFGHNRCE